MSEILISLVDKSNPDDPAKAAAQATNLATLTATVGAAGAGLTALAPASTALSTGVWTGTKAGFLDAAISGVSTGGTSASSIATAVWQDLLSGSDFSTVGSVGKLLKDDVNAPIGSVGGGTAPTVAQIRAEMDSNSTKLANLDVILSTRLATSGYTAPPGTGPITTAVVAGMAGAPVGSVAGPVASVTAPVSINLGQTGLSPRALDSVGDSSLTVGDGLVAAISGAAGKETVVNLNYVVKTPSTGTTIRTFTLDSAQNPTSRS